MNAPRSYPNNSVSSSVSGIAAQLIAVKSLFPAGLPYDSPTSIPAMAIPASRNFSNIHCSSLPGKFGSVGAYQTHGFDFAFGPTFAGMTNGI